MHHVKSVTELRIAPTLDTAAFNWVTRYNLSCSCFNPVFNPPLSLVFINSVRHCLSLPFHGSSLDSSRLPREKLLLVPFRQKRGYNLQNLIPWTIGVREGGEPVFSFFFRHKSLIFGRCIRVWSMFRVVAHIFLSEKSTN